MAKPTIAYLAPELPALSATFVYEEMAGVERAGVAVLPFSVHRPGRFGEAQAALAARVQVLYAGARWGQLVQALSAVIALRAGLPRALRWLATDMATVGLGRLDAWKLAYQWLAGARLGVALRRAGCTHLHVHFAHVPTQIAMYASALTGIPFTIMAHANDIFERGLLLPRKAQRAVKMLTISQHNVDYLLRVGVEGSKLAVVRCGVSFASRAPVARARREHYRIGTLGRLVEKKGVDDLLRALAQISEAGWTWELSVAGDGPLRGELEALAASFGLLDRVRFEGAMSHDQVGAWMQSLDVFALACKADINGDMDGIPVVLMEAMSQRVPVISTRLSGIPELVVHEKTGLLAEPADPASLAAQVRRLLGGDPAWREDLAEQAVRHVQAEFSQAVNIERLIKYFPVAAEMEPL